MNEHTKSEACCIPTGLAAWAGRLLALLSLLAASASAQTVAVVASFSGAGASASPGAVTPAQARNGILYGTTLGASGSDGGVFRTSTEGALAFPYTFTAATGSQPSGGLLQATDGNLYGTTTYGGDSNDGVFFKITAAGAYTALHQFAGGNDGANPMTAPIEGADGNIYGITSGFTSANSTVFKYTPIGGNFSTVYSLGDIFASSLIQATNGNLYGTTTNSYGFDTCGEIFEITTSGTLVWSYVIPCKPGNESLGATPVQIIQGSDGNFYGVDAQGGGASNFGAIFKVDQQGNYSVIYTIPSDIQFAPGPVGLLQATDGNLYGVTEAGGGQYYDGTLFRVTTSGEFTLLYSFNGRNGNGPMAAPVQDTNGLLYGTTQAGGKANAGVIYSYNAGLDPFVAFVLPSGSVGQSAQILGQNLTGTTSVTFNGVPATSFSVESSTYMTAVVPSGATTGPVVVTTPTGTLTSNKNFTIQQ
jgi:uncharacterized repeat protein (TIGR03803 family)